MMGTVEVTRFLIRTGLAGAEEGLRCEALTGGVSSDIWKVRARSRSIVVKRALSKLKVAQDWRVPVTRNASEAAWLMLVHSIVPDAVPAVLAHDPDAGLFAMDYLEPGAHPVWKTLLRDGQVDLGTAQEVGRRIAAVHAATAHDADVARRFANDSVFHSIRLEPYLEATARAHPDLAAHMLGVSEATLRTHMALVHGDVSPKNILIGPRGPIFLDAECAWFGDPAFDLAFCLNHLLLKCLWKPAASARFLAAFDRLAASYLDKVSWEPRADTERRIARLLPMLLLARVDGKSPVEYVTAERDKDRVRRAAKSLILNPVERLAGIRAAWERELTR
ncbi:MAG: phosphotransferase family protein [Hyphomicrobiales bacterium]